MTGQKKDTEFIKALIEYWKHLTTLSTGSIILITTFLEKLFQNPLWKTAVIISLIGFMVSVLSSIIAYTIAVIFELPETREETPDWASTLGGLGLIFTWVGFLTGILSLAVFALRNLVK